MRCVWLLAILIGLAGCTKGNFSQRAARANELRLVHQTAPATFDPARSQDIYTNELMNLVFEGLVSWGSDNTIQGRLAERWDISGDGKTYTFHLREAKFSDGRRVTAGDFKATWERNANTAKGSPLASNYLGDIDGVREVIDGKRADISGVSVIDDRTLQVRLIESRPAFLGKLTYPATFVLPAGTGEILKAEAMVGSGPFVVESYVPEQQTKLRPNANYHGPRSTLSQLTLRVVKDSATRLNLFRSGEIDVVTLSQQDVAGVTADKAIGNRVERLDRAATVYVGMNGQIYKPFADSRVRRAFVMSVDRDFIVREILRSVGRKADGILPPAVPHQGGAESVPPFDPLTARALLKQTAWEGKLPPVELWVNDANKDRKAIAEFIVTQLRDHLGVDAKVRLADANFIIQKATKRELGFFYGSWYADYLDPENFLSVLLSEYGQNRTAYDNPIFTMLCRDADRESDPEKRRDLYRRAEDIALRDCPWIPLYFPQDAVVTQPWVTGLEYNAFGLMPPVGVRVKLGN